MNKREKEVCYQIAMGRGFPDNWEYSINKLGYQTPGGRYFVGDIDIKKEIDNHTCSICGDGPDPDIRWLRIGCFYELTEVSK